MVKHKSNREIAGEVCKKFPQSPSLTLARKLLADYPERFATLDSARTTIRTVRGASGKDALKYATVPRDHQKAFNPLGLPESFEQSWEPFFIEDSKSVAIAGDLHIPYHNITAITAFLQEAKRRKIDTFIINGDLVDYHTLSRFIKDPTARSLHQEREATKQFFKVLRRLFPKARIVYKLGNHEERQEIYVQTRCAELLDLPELSYEEFFDLKNFGVELVKDKRIIKLGKLPVIHGHEYPGGASGNVNIARSLFNKAKGSVLGNHHHQTSEHTETTISGDLITTWSLGCLCELNPAYARLNRWNHGGAFVEIDSAGNYEVENKRILNGRIL
jgi:predicted phosphodiesterase